MVERIGASFSDPSVVENYTFRPPYPPEVYNKLLAICSHHNCLLDLGCGPGKISRPLSRYFKNIIAIDPSEAMIDLAHTMEGGRSTNIQWIAGLAEDYEGSDNSLDLIVAAASIHWMEHYRLFPRLKSFASASHKIAIVEGDTPFKPAWAADWKLFLAKWVPIVTGKEFDHDRKQEMRSQYQSYLNLEGTEFFISEPIKQDVGDFIRCQHSRDTFAPSRLGDDLRRFDAELLEILSPHADDLMLQFSVGSEVVWGTIK
ncbi:MAG: class I SAM-dependent methyltransferase [Agrobacterium sp.]|nr:class I SAM-dependent methyltransferase [Agrobacterium sp.]